MSFISESSAPIHQSAVHAAADDINVLFLIDDYYQTFGTLPKRCLVFQTFVPSLPFLPFLPLGPLWLLTWLAKVMLVHYVRGVSKLA